MLCFILISVFATNAISAQDDSDLIVHFNRSTFKDNVLVVDKLNPGRFLTQLTINKLIDDEVKMVLKPWEYKPRLCWTHTDWWKAAVTFDGTEGHWASSLGFLVTDAATQETRCLVPIVHNAFRANTPITPSFNLTEYILYIFNSGEGWNYLRLGTNGGGDSVPYSIFQMVPSLLPDNKIALKNWFLKDSIRNMTSTLYLEEPDWDPECIYASMAPVPHFIYHCTGDPLQYKSGFHYTWHLIGEMKFYQIREAYEGYIGQVHGRNTKYLRKPSRANVGGVLRDPVVVDDMGVYRYMKL